MEPDSSGFSANDLGNVVDILESIQIVCHTVSDHWIDDNVDRLSHVNRAIFRDLKNGLSRFKHYTAALKELPNPS